MVSSPGHPHPADPAALTGRLQQATAAAAGAGLDALLITPGPDLRYLTGYPAPALERLTCLLLPVDGRPLLLVPELERPAALASPVAGLDLRLVGWAETDDPYRLLAAELTDRPRVGVENRMWAERLLTLQQRAPGLRLTLAGPLLGRLRAVKSPAELAALGVAAAAIDQVHRQVPGLLRVGRTERAVARDLRQVILDAGHAEVDFVIVGSGPNAASPHHRVSDRVLQPGDAVVVDIGGTTPDGYCSDATRTYAVGAPPPDGFVEYYRVLQEAQAAGCAAVRPGVTAEQVDSATRQLIDAAGYGPLFVHRTGHGIGLETHEEPYIVAGNSQPLAPGMVFSVEPGIYQLGRHGARIEDIVACTASGGERLNSVSRELFVTEG